MDMKFIGKRLPFTQNEKKIILSLFLLFLCLIISLSPKNSLDTKAEARFVNSFAQEEDSINTFLLANKKDEFTEKIHELLLLKYPSKVVAALEKTSEKEYIFNDTFLLINYKGSSYLENSPREYNLKVDFNEIKDYLNFKVNLSKEYVNENGFDYDPNKITVVFTFDDSPNSDKTEEILRNLEDYKMSATFYMVGNKLNIYPETVKKVALSHSEIGYHSYNHQSFTLQKEAEIKEEFYSSDDILYTLTGKHFMQTRPPYGAYNNDILLYLDTTFITWSIDTLDWKFRDSKYVYNKVLKELNDGDIILFHDSYKSTVEATTRLMETLYLNDIQIVSVSQYASLKGLDLKKHEVYSSFK